MARIRARHHSGDQAEQRRADSGADAGTDHRVIAPWVPLRFPDFDDVVA